MQERMEAAVARSEDAGERRRVEAVVETLARLEGRGESLAEVAHDARNMVTALTLYCELLEEPGALTEGFRHYGQELRLVAAASRRLVEKLVALEGRAAGLPLPLEKPTRSHQPSHWEMLPAVPVENLAAELAANRNLLAALAGSQVRLTVESEGGARAVRMTGEDLTRVLVNLVKNAAEALPKGGSIRIHLRERKGGELLELTVEDDGPGIPRKLLERVFETGYTTRADGRSWPVAHRGLGLGITRSIVEAAGGRVRAESGEGGGARMVIELPARPR